MKQILRKLRFFYLKHIKWRNYKIGRNIYVGPRVYIWCKETMNIGDNFYIGKDSQIECDAIIGNNVIFGNKVAIVGKYDHHFQKLGVPTRLAPRIRDANYNWKGLHLTTIIEDDVWVGYGSIIMQGVKIGKGGIIAAGTLVTKDTEPFFIYGGNPARKLRPRFKSEDDLKNHLSIEKDFLLKNKDYKGI